ncbi:MAG: peptide-methionine (S)-S-oxide reductase MsrA [Rhodothalassiaceae bacterium]
MRFSLFVAGLVVCLPAAAQAQHTQDTARAIFAAGCFWCVEEAFEKVEGVVEAVSGYAGGTEADPTYEQVTAGRTGHVEAVEVRYDPAKISYADLLNVYWLNVDPLDGQGQFCDRGVSYRPMIFPLTDEQERLAIQSRSRIGEKLDQSIPVRIDDPIKFYPAEDYHQDYAEKNPLRYRFYKWSCGREQRLDDVWGEDREPPLDLAHSGS